MGHGDTCVRNAPRRHRREPGSLLSRFESTFKYAGDLPTFPPTGDNPYFSRLTPWWVDLARLVARHGRDPKNLAEYVAWSQAYQAEMLCLAMKACKDRFPACGGVLLWSGHDTFPMPLNTSIIDYDGNPKPAALALSKVWRSRETDAGSESDRQALNHS